MSGGADSQDSKRAADSVKELKNEIPRHNVARAVEDMYKIEHKHDRDAKDSKDTSGTSAKDQALSTLNEKFKDSFNNLNVVDVDSKKGLTLSDDLGKKYNMDKEGEVKDGDGKHYVFTQQDGKMSLIPESKEQASARVGAEQLAKEYRDGIDSHNLNKFKNDMRGLLDRPDSDPVKKLELDRLSNHIQKDIPGFSLDKSGLDERTGYIKLRGDADKSTYLLDQQGHMYKETKGEHATDTKHHYTLEKGEDGKLQAHKLESHDLKDKNDPERFANINVLRDGHNKVREVEMPNHQRLEYDYDKSGVLTKASRLAQGGQILETTTLDVQHHPPHYVRRDSHGMTMAENKGEYQHATVNQETGALTLVARDQTIEEHPNGGVVVKSLDRASGDSVVQVWGANSNAQEHRPGTFVCDASGLVKTYTDDKIPPTQYNYDGTKYATSSNIPVTVSIALGLLPGVGTALGVGIAALDPTQEKLAEIRVIHDGATQLTAEGMQITTYPDGRVYKKSTPEADKQAKEAKRVWDFEQHHAQP